MERKIRIGDRFKWLTTTYWYVFEYVELPYKVIIIDSNEKSSIGSYFQWQPNTKDEYLGNFNKVDNFTELYNLLNE